jgi:hypothetical protein
VCPPVSNDNNPLWCSVILSIAHLAFLPEPLNQEVDVYFLYMIGDRSGTVHLGNKQVMDLNVAFS